MLRMVVAALFTASGPMIGIAASGTPAKARPADCSAGHSQRATVQQIAASPEEYQGHCVAISGVLSSRKSPFSEIRMGQRVPQQIILVERSRLRDESDYSATICFCRAESCTGRWPIATFDADNVAARPYACTAVEPYVLERHRLVPQFTTPMEISGLAEPRVATEND
jgi:hypothetical protein